jgi:hypothetical protein
MTAAAFVACADPERLARAMARHFGHKVAVTTEGAVTGVALRMGSFELEPAGGGLAVRASAEDEERLADVRRITADHLARFARPQEIDVHWTRTEGER